MKEEKQREKEKKRKESILVREISRLLNTTNKHNRLFIYHGTHIITYSDIFLGSSHEGATGRITVT